MTDLLIELFTEEIPARFQAKAEENFATNITTGLKKSGLEFDNVKSFSTPRRLSVIVGGLPDKQPDIVDERKGPKADAPEGAINGFLKSVGLTIDDCEIHDTEKGKVYYAVIDKKGLNTVDVLPEIINSAINNIAWGNSMRFADYDFRFIRPLRRIIAVFGNDTVFGSLDMGGREMEYTGSTAGHRFLSNGDIEVTANNYEQKLKDEDIVINRSERKEIIFNDLEKQSAELGINLIADNGLLEEVVGLVEMPVVLIGKIEPRFMELPKEVLTTSMREHQKFFAFEKSNGELAPYFATVANIKASDGGTAIIKGNERVLRARLADSEFFYHNDLKGKLEDNLSKLEKMTFHAKLGTVAGRVSRMTSLAEKIAININANKDDAVRATGLAKADLVSEMVFEFPELQGIMGAYYATAQGENDSVVSAIKEHYQPQGANDDCPTNPVSISVSMAEKLDTLTGFWLIDEKPTGSKDPYALRRCALGIIRMILENKLRVDLSALISTSAELHTESGDVTADLLSFFAERVKAHLKSTGVRHDYIGGVMSQGITDLVAQVNLATELSNNSEVVSGVKSAFVRAKNITGKVDGLTFSAVDESKLIEAEEKELFTALATAKSSLEKDLESENFSGALSTLANLNPVLDMFFEKIMVNADDVDLKTNRLNILGEIITTVNSVADFDIIEG